MEAKLSPQKLDELKDAFAYFDRDGDGTITSRELAQIMRSMEKDATNAELQFLMKEIDRAGKGSISFDDFVAMMSANQSAYDEKQDDIREAFEIFDRDRNGFITPDELKVVFTNLGLHYSDDELNEIIHENDTDGDGKIDYDDFEKMMTKQNLIFNH